MIDSYCVILVKFIICGMFFILQIDLLGVDFVQVGMWGKCSSNLEREMVWDDSLVGSKDVFVLKIFVVKRIQQLDY